MLFDFLYRKKNKEIENLKKDIIFLHNELERIQKEKAQAIEISEISQMKYSQAQSKLRLHGINFDPFR